MAGGIGIEVVETIDSTSDELKRRAGLGCGEIALMARQQIAGHGRHGRVWRSPAGNLHLSILLRPGAVAMPGHWSLLTAVAVAEAVLRHAPGAAVRLKWPNDVLSGGRKVAGILLESGADPAPWLVIGIGVNLVHAPADLGRPTACLADAGAAPDPEEFAADLVRCLVAWRQHYLVEGWAAVRTAWLARGPEPGTLIATTGPPRVEGRFWGLGGDGSLVVYTVGGLVEVSSGEVSGG